MRPYGVHPYGRETLVRLDYPFLIRSSVNHALAELSVG
jgi:hypothetical protein